MEIKDIKIYLLTLNPFTHRIGPEHMKFCLELFDERISEFGKPIAIRKDLWSQKRDDKDEKEKSLKSLSKYYKEKRQGKRINLN